MDLLGGDDNSASLILDSPFQKENLKLLIAPKVSIKYKNRDKSYQDVCDYIINFVTQKVGNYLVYLPSYEYLDKIMEKIVIPDEIDIHIQKREMSDIEKNDFLDYFEPNPSKSHVGFVIIGGTFGEGIDLVSDRLIGLIIVVILWGIAPVISKYLFNRIKIFTRYSFGGNSSYFAYE